MNLRRSLGHLINQPTDQIEMVAERDLTTLFGKIIPKWPKNILNKYKKIRNRIGHVIDSYTGLSDACAYHLILYIIGLSIFIEVMKSKKN